MDEVSGAIFQMAVMLLIACIGYAAERFGVVDGRVRSDLARLLLDVTLPCMVLASAAKIDPAVSQGFLGWAFVLAALQFFLLLGCGALCNALLRTPVHERPLYLFMSVATNSGFIGLPVIAAIYGQGTVVVSSIFIAVMSLFVYSVGFAMLEGPRQTGLSDGAEAESSAKAPHAGNLRALLAGARWKAVFNPSMAASVVAVAMILTGASFPPVIQESLDLAGSVTSPIAMMIVGGAMATSNLRAVAGEVRLYPFILVRQLIAPTVLYFALRSVVPDPVLAGVFAMMFVMPVGSMAASFAERFGRDPVLPAKGTVLSTLASFVIVPLLVYATSVF